MPQSINLCQQKLDCVLAQFTASYCGCQKIVPFPQRFFLQPRMPGFRIRNLFLKSGINLGALPQLGYWKAGITGSEITEYWVNSHILLDGKI